MALQIMERREDFPGRDRRAARRSASTRSRSAPTPRTMLGYLGPVTDDELAEREQQSARRGPGPRPCCSAPT